MDKTNLKEFKNIIKCLLYIDIEETEYSPIVITHPIFESGFVSVKTNKGFEILNIIESEDNLLKARKFILEQIENAKTIEDAYFIVRKSYRLTLFKYANEYLSDKDYGKLLAHAWTSSENPNNDINVSLKESIKYFRNANKKYLMEENEYKIYKSFKDGMEVYRGVGIGRIPNGLSWTTDIDKASWFAHRFDFADNNKTGYIQKINVNKDDILAYFEGRDESEVVVDTTNYKIDIL